MKNICIITGAFNDYFILTPLIKKIQSDSSLNLTVIASETQTTPEFEISYIRHEEEGFILDEETNIVFSFPGKKKLSRPAHFPSPEYSRILKKLNPDIVILANNGYETFSAAIAASQLNLPIAHIQGGESNFGPCNDSYGYGITKLSHVHFTSTEIFRQEVIGFGEHPKSVFNVGSLLSEKIKTISMRGRSLFTADIGLDKTDLFIFVRFNPDMAMGSKNRQFLHNILESLADERFKNFKIILGRSEHGGLGKIILQQMESFALNHPDRIVLMPSVNLCDLIRVIKYSSAVVGNCIKDIIIASIFKTSMINVCQRLPDGLKISSMIDSIPEKEKIIHALQNGLSAEFKSRTGNVTSPFEQTSPAGEIKKVIKRFSRRDITPKTYYSQHLSA